MKIFKLTLLLILLAMPAFAGDIKSGDDVIAAMYKKYAGKWYKTLTFVQKTIHHKDDGTSTSEIWYEAMTVPGKLRIDFADSKTGDGILFADGKIYSFRDGKPATGRPLVHPLMVLGFDVYGQPAATTVEQVKGLGIDLSVVHEEKWMGKDVYVVGAKQGDVTTPQFWVDEKDLVFVRLIQTQGRDKKSVAETQFNRYVKAKGGWVAAEVKFFVDGKPTTTEEYSDIQAGMSLNPDLWNPDKWTTVDKTYYKKK
ncbi:MAG TPA: hypothetical protein PLP21_15465 [Pyrinomonadaceae bacterium]|nr:hypothetical protein [Acidobacteriota bacterium]HQZ97720.1 hypothetical protein [Pyrinomonadaceae bacterium]